MSKKSKILLLCFTILISCQSEEQFLYEEIQAEIDVYLSQQPFNDFTFSDTLVIYDTSYFNKLSETLGRYSNKLVEEDSIYNLKIVDRLRLVQKEKIQQFQPSIYLPFKELQENLSVTNTNKIMVWLSDLPKQFEAAKSQLNQPDKQNTMQTIEDLKEAFDFVSNDLVVHLDNLNQAETYNTVIENSQLAIKDYLAFLNSKLLNGEVSD